MQNYSPGGHLNLTLLYSRGLCGSARGRVPFLVRWQILPLILMFVMFGPIILSGLIFVCDYVVNSEWGIKIGLADDPRARLTKFYKKHNPTKMRDVRRQLNAETTIRRAGGWGECFCLCWLGAASTARVGLDLGAKSYLCRI